VTNLGILFFFVVAFSPIGFVHLVVSLVFVDGVLFIHDELSSASCFSFAFSCPLLDAQLESSILIASLSSPIGILLL
jgi:hypothetical protein